MVFDCNGLTVTTANGIAQLIAAFMVHTGSHQMLYMIKADMAAAVELKVRHELASFRASRPSAIMYGAYTTASAGVRQKFVGACTSRRAGANRAMHDCAARALGRTGTSKQRIMT